MSLELEKKIGTFSLVLFRAAKLFYRIMKYLRNFYINQHVKLCIFGFVCYASLVSKTFIYSCCLSACLSICPSLFCLDSNSKHRWTRVMKQTMLNSSYFWQNWQTLDSEHRTLFNAQKRFNIFLLLVANVRCKNTII